MSITLGDAILYFRGDESQLEKDLKGAESKTKGFFGKLAGGAGKLLGGAIVGATTAAAGAVVGIGAAALGVSTDMRQASNDIQAQLGETEARAKQLGEVAKNVWLNNFGGSIEEATQAIIVARQQLGNLSDRELQDATENAFRLSDAFGVDVTESLSAARTLTQEFGLSQQEAFDLMAAGFQRGLNNSGDFLDTIGEYSNLFAESGADAGQFFSLMESGLAGGVLGTDKAADAFKEFSIRVIDGSKQTMGALEALQGPNEDFMARIQSGEISIARAFEILKDRIWDLDDPIEQQTLGVALFGTQWEDLGSSAAFAIDLAGTKLEDLAGATDKIDVKYQNFGALFEGFRRKALGALQPLGDLMLDLANRIMPSVEGAFGFLGDALPGVIDRVTAAAEQLPKVFGELGRIFLGIGGDVYDTNDAIREFLFSLGLSSEVVNAADTYLRGWEDTMAVIRDFVLNSLVPALQQIGSWLLNEGIPAFVEFAVPIIQQVIPGLQLLAEIGVNLATAVMPILASAFEWVGDNMNIVLPILAAVGVAILALTSPITLVAGGVLALATAWANNWGDIQGKTQAVIDFIVPLINGAMEGIKAIVQPILEYLSQWWADHGDNVMLIIRTVFDFVVKYVTDRIKETQAVIEAVGEFIRRFWDAWGATILALARLTWDNIVTTVRAAMDVIGYIIDAVAAVIRGDWEAFGEALKGIWTTVWEAMQTIVSNRIEGIVLIVKNLIDQVKEPWTNFVEELESAWKGTWDAIADYVRGIVSAIMKPIQDLIDAIKDLFDIDLPDLPGLGWGRSAFKRSAGNSQSFSLTLNSSGRAGSLVGEFQAMQAMLGT